jgi:hypothetical protein
MALQRRPLLGNSNHVVVTPTDKNVTNALQQRKRVFYGIRAAVALFVPDKPIFSVEKILHKEYNHKGSVAIN